MSTRRYSWQRRWRRGTALRQARAGALLAAGLLAGCSGTAEVERDRIATVRLAGVAMNSGQIGTATLIPQGDRTVVEIEVSGVPGGVTRPVHLFTYIYEGTCGS